MTVLADEEQALVGTIGITGMSAPGTSLAGIVGVYFDRHRTAEQGFIRNHALQLGKRPFGVGRIGFPLLQTGLFAFLAFRSFSNVCQMFQADHGLWVLCHDAFGDDVIGVLLQPSLSSTDVHQTACGGTSAFFLKTLSQSRIMVRFGNDVLAAMEGAFPFGSRGDSKIADSHIDANDFFVALRCRQLSRYPERHEQVELLVWLVIPQLCRTNLCPLLNECDMLLIARIGDNDASLKGQDTHLSLCFEGKIFAVLVGQGGGNVPGWMVQSLVSLLRSSSLAVLCILLDFLPEGLIGSTNLPGHRAGHLGGEMKTGTDKVIGSILQSDFIAHLAVCVSILTHKIEGVPVRQLRDT